MISQASGQYKGKLTEAALFVVKRIFPHWLDGAGLVHDEVVVGRTAVTVLSRHPGKTDALPGQWITSSSDGELRVTATLLTAVRSEVPEPVETSLALLAGDARLAGTLAGGLVTLRELTGLATVAGQTAVRPVLVEAPVVDLTLVTADSLHSRETETLARPVVTLPGPVQVTVTRLAVVADQGVPEEPGLRGYWMILVRRERRY